MELREGYKQTEVGVIPEDWVVTQLGDIGQFKNGINKGAESFGHGSPFVNLLDVFGKNFLLAVDSFGLVDSNDTEQGAYNLKKGDVIFIRSSVKPSGVGLTAVVTEDLPQTVYSGFLIRYRDKGQIDINYKKYCFYGESFRKKVISSSSVSANTNINQDNLKRLLLAFPPTKTEQTAIANALSDADSWIQSLTHLIAKKRQVKQGTMQTLLNPYENGRLKAGWVVKKLGEVTDILTGLPFPSAGYTDEGIRLLRGSNIKRGKTDWNDEIRKCWPSITADIKKYVLKEGDIVVAMDGSLVGRSFAQLQRLDLPAILLQRVSRIRVKSDSYDINYIKEWVCSEIFTIHCDSLKTVTAIPHISPTDIYSFELNIPVLKDEQTRIATILSDMDADIVALETKLTKTQQIKQGMMQNLLTGKIRLVSAQKVAN